jgi:hypothetical protein
LTIFLKKQLRISCIKYKEIKPVNKPARAKENKSVASNHIGTLCLGSKWIKSVIRYGELGKNRSHINIAMQRTTYLLGNLAKYVCA